MTNSFYVVSVWICLECAVVFGVVMRAQTGSHGSYNLACIPKACQPATPISRSKAVLRS